MRKLVSQLRKACSSPNALVIPVAHRTHWPVRLGAGSPELLLPDPLVDLGSSRPVAANLEGGYFPFLEQPVKGAWVTVEIVGKA